MQLQKMSEEDRVKADKDAKAKAAREEEEKKKAFTTDHEGNKIIIKAVNRDVLPSSLLHLKNRVKQVNPGDHDFDPGRPKMFMDENGKIIQPKSLEEMSLEQEAAEEQKKKDEELAKSKKKKATRNESSDEDEPVVDQKEEKRKKKEEEKKKDGKNKDQ